MPGGSRKETIRLSSKNGHLKAKCHIRALAQAQAERTATLPSARPAPPPTPLVPPAQLKWTPMATRLAREDDDGPPGAGKEFFLVLDGVVFEDGHVFQGGEEVHFTAGVDPEVERKQHEQQIFKKLSNLHLFRDELWDSSAEGGIDGEEPDDDCNGFDHDACSAFESLDVPENTSDISLEDLAKDRDWEPYGSKTMFMLDLLDRLPRLRISDDHMKTIIWIIVLTFTGLRKLQERLKKDIGVVPEHHTLPQGNHFYTNHPAKLFALDFANPLVRNEMIFYPEVDPNEPLEEMWQADKWVKEVPDNELSPMWCSKASRKHYYVNEITESLDGQFIVPKCWVTKRGVVYAQGYLLSYSKTV
ncbi:hypothetical protein BKA70DRAFT_1225872 [Coprinopsis sp. MPI-PUGE-AT-0042]|nr:hypothetical protein BKA70DRAFT_1225872 [Coprinopsis sp. MPI-PUGE-AT-0042]